jgi:hypothetical protein
MGFLDISRLAAKGFRLTIAVFNEQPEIATVSFFIFLFQNDEPSMTWPVP